MFIYLYRLPDSVHQHGGKNMKSKDCKIVCDGVEVATIRHEDGELTVKATKEGKKMCQEFCNGCC
jgi:hypothetical protein